MSTRNGVSELVHADRPSLLPIDSSMGCPALADNAPLGDTQGSSHISVEPFGAVKHYDIVCKWWMSQNWPTVPLDHLPRTGLVVNLSGAPAAAVWIFQSDSAFCWIAFPIAGKHIRKKARARVLSELIASAKKTAKAMGYASALMSLRNGCFEKRIMEQGFVPTDRGVTHYYGDLRR